MSGRELHIKGEYESISKYLFGRRIYYKNRLIVKYGSRKLASCIIAQALS